MQEAAGQLVEGQSPALVERPEGYSAAGGQCTPGAQGERMGRSMRGRIHRALAPGSLSSYSEPSVTRAVGCSQGPGLQLMLRDWGGGRRYPSTQPIGRESWGERNPLASSCRWECVTGGE